MDKIRIIAEIKVSQDTEAEKLQALKEILIKAGLLVEIDGRDIIILERT